MLRELHSTHLGIIKTKSNARSRMWWPGIDSAIERWIGSCTTCASVRPAPPRDPPAPWPAATAAWQRVHIDYMTVGQRVYLVVVDSYSKWVECIHMHNGTTTKALIAKLKQVFSTFGIPNVLVSDNDVKINSVEFKTFCSSNGIKYMTSPIYHPPSNGQAENSVRTCKKMLKCILKDNLSLHQINEMLMVYLFSYRNTVHCTTGETPAKLMFGRNLRSRLDLVVPTKKSNHDETSTVRGRRKFSIGDDVWTRWYSARKETWQLGKIKGRIGNKMYNIYINDFDVYCVRHVDQLLKYTGSNEPSVNNSTDKVPHQEHSPVISFSTRSGQTTTLPAVSSEQLADNAPVVPDADCVADGDGEEWRDCEAIVSEGRVIDGTASSQPQAEQPETLVTEGSHSRTAEVCDVDVPSAPAPTPSRQKRTRNVVDYKKYF